MKIISWNLGHQTFNRPIPSGVLKVLRSIDADIIILNEYVDKEKGESFKNKLKELGYNLSLSYMNDSTVKRYNQILIASKEKHEVEEVSFNKPDCQAYSNFLMLKFQSGMRIAGLRMPSYKGKKREIWQERLCEIAFLNKGTPVVFMGDFNCNPQQRKDIKGEVIDKLKETGFRFENPKGEWSFNDKKKINGVRTKIDHVLVNSTVEVVQAEYIYEKEGIQLTDLKEGKFLMDHVPLYCEVKIR